MHVIEAPDGHPGDCDIFLAGGISGCPDWQSEVIELLDGEQGVALNPRRSGGFIDDIADEQISWEYHALRSVHTVFFWFPKETLCPIALLELGAFTQIPQTRLIVGTHPDYQRRFDVIKQLQLSRWEVTVHDNLEDMVTDYVKSIHGEPEEDTSSLNEVTFESENPAEWTASHADINDAQYENIKQAVLEEIDFVKDRGTLGELISNLEVNYTFDIMKARAILTELSGSAYTSSSDGKMIYIKSV